MSKTQVTVTPGTHEIVLTREFDAAPDVVYAALTDPAVVPSWWGPHGLTTKVEEMDVRPGGRWRFVQRDADGNEFGFNGVYHSVQPRRVVQTFEFEGMPGHVMLDTMTLEDLGGRTRLVDQSVFQSVEDRDGMVASGMQDGASQSHDRLDTILAGRTT
ncbi:MAG TPA: SRPBCC family protein [Asanoa sp.]